MKLRLDENLSPRLVTRIADIYAGSAHVQQCGLGSADDKQVWQHAVANEYSRVSNDIDFYDRSLLEAGPPKLV